MDLSNYQNDFTKVINHLKQDLKTLRGGRATPALVDNVAVDCYGAKTPLKQLASIHTPEPKLIVIEPWDKNLLKEVVKAIDEAKINLSATNDGKLVRIQLPPMTEENRKEIIKILHQKLEETRVSVRRIREELMKRLKNEKESGDIGEDKFFKLQKQVQEEVDKQNDVIKELGEGKEKEIMTV